MDEPRGEGRSFESRGGPALTEPPPAIVTIAAAGVVAGVFAALAFAAIHAALISDIWFSLAPLLFAGALCGLCVAWTFALLVPVPTAGAWVRYNLVYLGLFVALGAVSALVLEPIATVAELMAIGGSPGDLILASMPLNIAAVAVGTLLVTGLYRGGTRHLGPVLITVLLLVVFLGHNVSIIGLVEFAGSGLFLLAEFVALIFAINAVYVAAFLVLQWRRLHERARSSAAGEQRVPGGTPW